VDTFGVKNYKPEKKAPFHKEGRFCRLFSF